MALTDVNEGTTAYLTVAFLDADGVAALPTAVTWQCHDIQTGEELKAETAVTPGTSVEITIPPSVNTLVNQGSRRETHRITVRGTYGDDDQVTGKYDFVVVGLLAI